MSKVEDWKEESDLVISRAMKNVKEWESQLNKVAELKEDMDDIIAANNLDPTHADNINVNVEVESLERNVKDAIESIIAEDDRRELYTLDTSIADKVKLPTFEGREDEDFAKFKEQVERAFVENRVTKANKYEKLREVLIGYAKKLVPQSSTGSIEEAWKTLEKAFGDPSKLMKYRKMALLKLGLLPKLSTKDGLKRRVEWYLELETLVKEIIALGSKSERLGHEAFCDSNMQVIFRMFPYPMKNKLIACPGESKAKLQAILDRISKFRSQDQDALIVE